MEVFESDFAQQMIWSMCLSGVLVLGAGIQTLFCFFSGSKGVQLIPAIICKLIITAMNFAGVGLIIAAVLVADGWDSLGLLLLGVGALALTVFPLSFCAGIAAGWLIYALVRSDRRKKSG